MPRIPRTPLTLIAIGLLPILCSTTALAGSADCTSFHTTSGLRACVQFDNLPTAPVRDTDHEFNFDANGIPSVEFLNGRDFGGTLMEWRVWSEDNTGTAGDIVNLTAFGDFDYDVKILDGGDLAGAADVTNIDLKPSASGDFSSVTDAWITGSLGSGGISVRKSTGGNGGELRLVIEGHLTGSITANTLLHLEVQGDSSGDVTVFRAIDPAVGEGGIQIEGNLSGTIDIENYESTGHFTVGGDLAGTVDIET